MDELGAELKGRFALFIPDGLVVEDPDHIVPFPPDHPEPTPGGMKSVGLGVELVELLLRSFWHFSTPLADVALT